MNTSIPSQAAPSSMSPDGARDKLQRRSETGELPSMLQRFLDDKPTSVEAMAMGREAIPERDRIAVAVERLRDFEGKWGTPRRKTL